jgi:hypothetical protein
MELETNIIYDSVSKVFIKWDPKKLWALKSLAILCGFDSSRSGQFVLKYVILMENN